VGRGSAWSTMQCAKARRAAVEASVSPRRRAKSRDAMGASGVRGRGPGESRIASCQTCIPCDI